MNVALRHRDRVAWLTAAPLWDRSVQAAAALAAGAGAAGSARFAAPAILRFQGDDFMDQAMKTLAGKPADLARYSVRAETWRSQGAGWTDAASTAVATLWQPIHDRHYLAAATLVCRRPGLPDRALDRGLGDKVALLMRRLAPRPGVAFDPSNPAARQELAWIGDVRAGRWAVVADPALPADGEERLPMFPLPFRQDGRRRVVHAGVIPTGRANAYANAAGAEGAAGPAAAAAARTGRASAAESVGDPLGDSRLGRIREGVIGGLQMLSRVNSGPAPKPEAVPALLRQTRGALAMAMLDLGEFLEAEIPAVAASLRSGQVGGLTTAEFNLHDRLDDVALSGGYSVRAAIVRALDRRAALGAGAASDALVTQVLGTLPTLAVIASHAATLVAGPPVLLDRITAALPDPRAALARDLAAAAAQAVSAEALAIGGDPAAALLAQLLALDDLLAREMPDLAAALPTGPAPTTADAALLARFATPVLPALSAALTWGAALAEARAAAPRVLAGDATGTTVARLAATPAQIADAAAAFFAGLAPLVAASAAARPLGAAPVPVPEEADAPAHYVLRALYERPACEGVHDPATSAPSAPFRLGGFYDPDAPVRAIQIEMPARTSIADFRNAPKGVAIKLSKELRSQVSRVRNAVLDEPLAGQVGGGSFDLGVICTLSIPIITICALILLLIIVQLLNIVFWWLPYFIFCFPVRK